VITLPVTRELTRPLTRALTDAGAGGGFSPASLFANGEQGAWLPPRYESTLFTDAARTTPAAAGGQIGGITDKSGNGAHAAQATSSFRPGWPATGPARIRSDFINDVITSPDTGASEAWVNTPYGHYKTAMAGAFHLPLNDATEVIVRDGMTPEQDAAVSAYFGTQRVAGVFMSPDTTVTMNMYSTAGTPDIVVRFVGANGATTSRIWPQTNTATTVDVSVDGLTAPVAVVAETVGSIYFYCDTNQLTGSIPNLSANTALKTFYCYANQLTGSIPNLSANTALTGFCCYTNQLTGSIPNLSANTALTGFYCYANQLTGNIPNLSANTALTTFYCYTNQLTGWAGGGVPNTLGYFHAGTNALTQAAVDGILAAFVAAGRTSASGQVLLYLNGGTNAAPSAAGLVDKATLVSRGWTVVTN